MTLSLWTKKQKKVKSICCHQLPFGLTLSVWQFHQLQIQSSKFNFVIPEHVTSACSFVIQSIILQPTCNVCNFYLTLQNLSFPLPPNMDVEFQREIILCGTGSVAMMSCTIFLTSLSFITNAYMNLHFDFEVENSVRISPSVHDQVCTDIMVKIWNSIIIS